MTWTSTHRCHELWLPPNTIPVRFRRRFLSEIRNDAVVAVVRRYLGSLDDYASRGLAPAFLGKAGTYKTFGAAFIADRLYHEAHVPVMFVACSSRLPELERERYDARTNRYLQSLKTVPFLVMDDFTQVRLGSWTADMLLELADHRYGAGLPTLWTGNAVITATDQSALVNGYGASFARRVLEGSAGLRVSLV